MVFFATFGFAGIVGGIAIIAAIRARRPQPRATQARATRDEGVTAQAVLTR